MEENPTVFSFIAGLLDGAVFIYTPPKLLLASSRRAPDFSGVSLTSNGLVAVFLFVLGARACVCLWLVLLRRAHVVLNGSEIEVSVK